MILFAGCEECGSSSFKTRQEQGPHDDSPTTARVVCIGSADRLHGGSAVTVTHLL